MKNKIWGIMCAVAGGILGAVAVGKIMEKKIEEVKKMSDKHLSMFLMMNEWVRVKREEKEVGLYLNKNGYEKIAIYGMSYIGETLLEELKKGGMSVTYAIDKNMCGNYADIRIVSPEAPLEDVDAIVVTAISSFDEIKDMLNKRIDCPVISLKDILYEL